MDSPRLRPLRLLTNQDIRRYPSNHRTFNVYELKDPTTPNTSNWFELTGEDVFKQFQVFVNDNEIPALSESFIFKL